MNTGQIGKILVIGGVGLIVVGLMVVILGRFGFIGHLPGDITIQGKNFTVYLPILSFLIISLVLTLLVNLAIRLFK